MRIKDLPNKSLQTLLLDKYGDTEFDEVPDPLELIEALTYKVLALEEGLARTQNEFNEHINTSRGWAHEE